MRIGIVPSIKSFYKDDKSYVLDTNWYSFLEKIYKKSDIKIITNNKIKFNFDLVIISGGNDSLKFSKKKCDLLRNRIDNFVIKECLRKKIRLIGICWGAIKINEYFKGSTKKVKNHVKKNHYLKINTDKFGISKENIKVNSYHNFGIDKLGKNLNVGFRCAKDNSIEMYYNEKKKIFGIMWHPERYNRLKLLDKFIFKNI
tara:strand:+ start:50 stop:649 length:600 start_codon:yes stop_codon:yes gene_type:complete